MYYCNVLCIICICIYCNLYVCLCMLQCGRTALPNTGVENYKSINQSILIVLEPAFQTSSSAPGTFYLFDKHYGPSTS